ncbi:hypothetical protein ISS37_01370 [candidate division KSB1 bacterium]|nr:hypothetical protein [candidate division KSB1 bacterium]
MSLRYVGFNLPDAWTALQNLAAASFSSVSLIDNIYIFIFIFCMISIMYSTLDSLISSISYTTYYDIILKGNISEKAQLSKSRMWTIAYTFIFFILYVVVRKFVSGIDNILYTFYAFQLALFPSIILIFISKKLNRLSAYVSIIGGVVLCLIPLIINNEIINPYSSAAIFSVIGSTILYLLLTSIEKYKVENE